MSSMKQPICPHDTSQTKTVRSLNKEEAKFRGNTLRRSHEPHLTSNPQFFPVRLNMAENRVGRLGGVRFQMENASRHLATVFCQ